MTIRREIESQLIPVFTNMGLEPKLASVTTSDRPDLADYQCNGALAAARILKENPRKVAQKIVDQLKMPEFEISIAGPGFINFKCAPDLLVKHVMALKQDANLGVQRATHPEKIIIDYGGLNVAKPMHVGHLRSSIIGECLKRLLRLQGHEVIGDIHLGDWGTQMGLLLYGLEELYPEWVYFDPDFTGPYPKESPVSLEDLDALYPKMSEAAKRDDKVAEKARKAVQQLQQGRPGYRALWGHFVAISVADIRHQLDRLGVHFDQWFGESRYQKALAPLVDSLLKKGIAEHSDGAVIIQVQQDADKSEVPPLLIQKKDGGFLYGTTDLATIQERVEMFKADQIIYVVDQRQALHFEQVFRAAHRAQMTPKTQFIGFGTMNGPDNKPFKTRSGGVMRLEDLTNLLQKEALEKMKEGNPEDPLTGQEKEKVALQIGLAALKFADLQHDAKQNYQFSIEKFMRFEGRTGPYLQYAAVRMRAMLDKAHAQGLKAGNIKAQGMQPSERELLLHLARTPDYISLAAEQRAPHILCDAAFVLAQAFSRFYQNCPLLHEADTALQQSRLALIELSLRGLSFYLNLLGIEIPIKM